MPPGGLEIALTVATSGEAIALVTAVIAAVAAAISTCIAAWQGVLMKRSERNRTQPIIVAYEGAEPAREEVDLVFSVYLTNEGAGPAFNVRFGVAFDSLRCTYKPEPAGPQGAGDVPRGLGPGGKLPVRAKAYRLVAPNTAHVDDSALASRVYWCRYENAFGDSWETRNAWRTDVELEIDPLSSARHASDSWAERLERS